MTRTHVSFAAGFTLLARPIPAQFAEGFAAWDGNGDGSIGPAECTDTFSVLELFESRETDGDGCLSEQELAVALCAGYDSEESGQIEEAEFAQVVNDFQRDNLLEM
jgi:Ca2+-binding EF-hand superfamily protein